MDITERNFVQALAMGNTDALKQIPKSDLHCHAALGSRFADLQAWMGVPLPPPPKRMKGIAGMDAYLSELREVFFTRAGFEYTMEAAFKHAVTDGVSVLEMSIDCRFVRQYDDREAGLVEALERIHRRWAPEVFYIPQLGITREADPAIVFPEIEACLDTGYFRSIDLYGEELFRPPDVYRNIYRLAGSKGLRRKAHTGEFGDAASVRHTVEVLELDEVQHGITTASSGEIMKWLSDNKIQLNVCPTSNIVLGLVESLETHPMRILFDNGVPVTINSDDILLFDQSVSDEYFNVYNAKLFSAAELNDIRILGLAEAQHHP